jgi:hypothetical protein
VPLELVSDFPCPGFLLDPLVLVVHLSSLPAVL